VDLKDSCSWLPREDRVQRRMGSWKIMLIGAPQPAHFIRLNFRSPDR